jgi:uncharacterized protein
MIIDQLLEDAQIRLAGRSVADVRIGLGYTAVTLDDGGCGLAGTITEGADWSCSLLSDAGDLVGSSAMTLATEALSNHPVRSSVGVATINAVMNRHGEKGPGPLEVLPVDGARVALVGLFRPIVPELRRRAAELHIFERQPVSPETLPDWAAERILPDCDVAIITSLTLVNKTLDHLLELAGGEVALLGPTTPHSSVFAAHGVGHLFGRVVRDSNRILSVVSQAGGTQRFGSAAPKTYRKL